MVTRVTNTMLQNTLLSNLSMNLNRMDKLQNQLSSGRKYGHISDDPSALIYGQAARNKLARLGHYQATVETAQSWLTQAEAGVMEINKVIGAVYEELVSAGSVKTDSDKQNLAKVVAQLRDHYVDTLNTSYGDRFVFGAYNTPGDFANTRNADGVKPFSVDGDGNLRFNGLNVSQFDKMPSAHFDRIFKNVAVSGMSDDAAKQAMIDSLNAPPVMTFNPPPLTPITDEASFNEYYQDVLGFDFSLDDAVIFNKLFNDVLSLDVAPGVNMPITMNGLDVVFYTAIDENPPYGPIIRNTFNVLTEIYEAINGTDVSDPAGTEVLTKMIKTAQDAQNHLLTRTAEIGGRQRRLELLEARFAQDNLNYEKMRSDAEDADMAEVIMFLKMAETVYQAALSAGARVIQPTLMDFLR